MKQTESLMLIDEICREQGINVRYLSFGWIRELSKDGKICHIVRNAFDLNPAASYNIVNDKYATYEVLTENNISVLKHYMVFNGDTEGNEKFARNVAEEVNNIFSKIKKETVVLKANTSSEGKNVYLVNSRKEAIQKVEELFDRGFPSVSICPFEDLECEYRVIFLDDEILYVYKKIAREWKHNLADGAYLETNLDDDDKLDEVKKIAMKAGNATNSKFVTIDVSKRKNGELFVMEINGSVCMSKFMMKAPNGRQIAKTIYEKAIHKMFES